MAGKDPTKELYEIEVLENKSTVDGKNLGVTEFDKKKIVIPGFGDVLDKIYTRCSSKYDEYKTIIKGLKDYILGHEINVEAYGRPRTERQHSGMERDYLEYLKEEGYTLPYMIGLTLHNMRLKYGDRTGFSKNIKRYVRDKKEKFKDFVDALEEPLGVALGLKPVPVEYDRRGVKHGTQL